MRRLTLLCCVALIALTSPTAVGQTSNRQPNGDGGLHVCCGGSVGYVGGSGSISGNVVGPGGGGGGQRAAAPATDVQPNAATNGSLEPALQIRDSSAEKSTPAASKTSIPYIPIAAVLGALLLFVVVRTRRAQSPAGH